MTRLLILRVPRPAGLSHQIERGLPENFLRERDDRAFHCAVQWPPIMPHAAALGYDASACAKVAAGLVNATTLLLHGPVNSMQQWQSPSEGGMGEGGKLIKCQCIFPPFMRPGCVEHLSGLPHPATNHRQCWYLHTRNVRHGCP